MLPLVSIVIPTYNRAKMLVQAIDSVLAQDYPDFELIIIDDGSSDHTTQAVKKYNGKISYHYQTHQGVSIARNHGTRLAKGKYICFLDSDDLWHPKKLSHQVDFMQENPQIPLCYTDEIWVRNGVRVNPHKKHGKHSGWIFEYCLPLCIISPSSAMLRREFLLNIGGFDKTLPVCEDYDLWLRICKDHPVQFIPKLLITKRGGHADQLSHKYWGNDRFRIIALEKLIQTKQLSPSQRTLVKHSLVTRYRILANGSAKRGKTNEAKKYLDKIKQYGELGNTR